jgi:hypothetical protein
VCYGLDFFFATHGCSDSESQQEEASMRVTSSFILIFRFRIVRLIALSSVIAVAACQDVTAPDKVTALDASSLRLSQSSVADQLGELGSSLDQMTGWSLVVLPDGQGRTRIVGILNGLKGHLASGKVAACQQDVTDARAYLGSLTRNDQVELGGIGVTLDLIQYTLDKASQ